MNLVHGLSFRLNIYLYFLFLGISAFVYLNIPDIYPSRFDLSGNPVSWVEGKPELLIVLVLICSISFLKLHLIQRYLVNNPDSNLLNMPHKALYLQLPAERKENILIRVNRMLGIVNTLMLILFCLILLMIYFAAQNADSVSARATNGLFIICIITAVIFPFYELLQLNRYIKQELRKEGLMS